jgi:hypothetical protein
MERARNVQRLESAAKIRAKNFPDEWQADDQTQKPKADGSPVK